MFSAQNKENSIIHEISEIQNILEYIHPKSWAVLDLDNTLIRSAQIVGSDEWFSTLMQYACSLDINKEEAVIAVVTIYNAVQKHVSAEAVEAATVETIKNLQQQHIPVLALTARGKGIIEPTIQQLKNVGVDFSEQWGDHQFPLPLHEHNQQPIFHNGIIFCDGRKKGECLNAFFAAIDHKPEHVMMVDDKHHHLTCVGNKMTVQGIRFTGLRYNFLDEKIKVVDMEKAHIELCEMSPQFDQSTLDAIEKLNLSCGMKR